jgi:hypothetical protein
VRSCECEIETVAFRRLKSILQRLIVGLLVLAAGCNGSSGSSSSGFVHFVPNSHSFWSNPKNWTTAYGPAYADITLTASNFVPCRGGPYALCYYSGPNTGAQDLSCTLTPDGKYANCQCYDIPYGVYFVDINAILNRKVYEDTIATCGMDGSACGMINSAPVCRQVNQGTLIPGSKEYSTFSFDCVPTNGLGITNCAQAPYAGCMTAPCSKPDQNGLVQCSCPIYDGPYQVGQNEQECALGSDLVGRPRMLRLRLQPRPLPQPLGLPQLIRLRIRRRFPLPHHACRTHRAGSDARSLSPGSPCFRPAATSTARRSAMSTTPAREAAGARPAILATRRCAPTNATTATCWGPHARDSLGATSLKSSKPKPRPPAVAARASYANVTRPRQPTARSLT